ncbi:MAG: sulfatase-like hydrolase/transferase [Anaerohalosphaeraceae bacterium]
MCFLTRRDFLGSLGAGLFVPTFGGCLAGESGKSGTTAKPLRPNILMILVDDMGYADPSCYGGSLTIPTPNIDRLAQEGIRFTQFYVNSPVCSPSRVALMTGQYPARWRIFTYLDRRELNRQRRMADFLDPSAPFLTRQFKAAGYAAAHFGKWHMGGGRDVGDAPLPQEYGFDESSVAFEGLGDRLLIRGDGLSNQSARLGRGQITWVEKHQITQIRVDQALDFIRRHKDKPFYVNVWFNDVHDPHLPVPEQLEKFRPYSDNPYVQRFYAVLEEMDRQIGRLSDGLSEMGLEEKTLVILTSDNGPTDWASYYKEGWLPPGSVGDFKGRKWSLYEGGIRMPFIVRWKGTIPAGKVNQSTLVCGADLFPSLCTMAGISLPSGVQLDGEDMSAAFLGAEIERKEPIFWYYPNDPKPGNPKNVSPVLAVREGQWKLLAGLKGQNRQLYNLANDPNEQENLAQQNPQTAQRLWERLRAWADSIGLER